MNAQLTDAHPTIDDLAAYSRGEMAEGADRQIEEHLGTCEPCCRTLSGLSNDTMVSLLRPPAPAPDTLGHQARREQPTLLPSAEQPTCLPRGDVTQGHVEPQVAPLGDLPPELASHTKYQILALVGRGGMGNVYRAQHRLMNRCVALKVINQDLVRSESAVRRFHREMQAAARLSHPNIVAAYDAEQAGNTHFLVMEYVDGVDLAEVVRRRGPLPVGEACDYLRQAALGLQYAHERGMVHRDIKPQNLMLAGGDRGTLKILDFGLAQFASEAVERPPSSDPESAGKEPVVGHLTQSGAMMGTPDYISPEQARDAHTADIRADIYSLGCTLYCLLSGSPPFANGTALDKVMAHVEREPAPLRDKRSDVPAVLEAVLQRMLAKNPAERYQTPAAVAQALEAFVGIQQSGDEFRLKPGLQPRPSKRRSPLAPLAVAAVFVLGLCAALGALVVVVTDRGRLEIQSEVEDVKLVVNRDGKQVVVIDLATGSQVRWLPSGKYEVELKGDKNDVKLEGDSFQLSRLGRAVVVAKWNDAGLGMIRRFVPSDKPITQDGVTPDDGGWKITADSPRTARLFEVSDPKLTAGPFFYRVRLKTENVKGRAYLEMWVRIPGEGEFFSKGFVHAASGTNGWAEYETSFYLKKGQQPDLVKLNLTIEGTGAVWIKDIEVRGRRAGLPGETPAHDKEQAALAAAQEWLKLRDAGKFAQAWESSARLNRAGIEKDEMVRVYVKQMKSMGIVKSRELISARYTTSLPDAPTGDFVVVQNATKFAIGGATIETVVLMQESDGAWRVSGYFIKDSAQGAGILQTLSNLFGTPGAARGAAAPNAPPNQSVATGINLLQDASFEAASQGGLPAGWSAWLKDGPKFRCEVVPGGVTGKQCLQIAGEGTRGVVFANGVPVDRTKRYALKGRVKLAGEKGTAAVVKFNYFHEGKWLGVQDLAGVTSEQEGWQLLEKTDSADAFPAATQIWISCLVEGNGTAWFDDLELLAFDRSALVRDFDAKFGKQNRVQGGLDLSHLAGTWETTLTYKPTADAPQERTVRGVTRSRLMFSDRFLVSQWKSDADEEEFVWLLTFDENVAAYRYWAFSNTGQIFERAGQWDAKTQTLRLEVKPPSPGVKGVSVERFVSDTQTEGTLVVKNAAGRVTRDAQFMSRRKGEAEAIDFPKVAGPAATPTELTILEKLAGDWTNRSVSKPSVWMPDGNVETSTERIEWALGGRFLAFWATDAQGQGSSLSLMTYEPDEKAYRFWMFSTGASGGQWRVTWDESSRAFHWRSIDMPAGWIGTAFNRWIDDDTFDDQALIKDDKGQVLLDIQILKKRIRANERR